MVQPRKPLASLRAKGTILKGPAKYADRREPKTAPLGEPSPHLTGIVRAAWFSFVAEIPWLVESDRAVLEVACHIRGQLMAGEEDIRAAHLNLLRQCLSTMGATPADRSRITAPKEPEPDDPTAVFFNA
jgi:hypothetical protein